MRIPKRLLSANCRQLFGRHHPASGLASAVLGEVFTLPIRLLGLARWLAGEDAILLLLRAVVAARLHTGWPAAHRGGRRRFAGGGWVPADGGDPAGVLTVRLTFKPRLPLAGAAWSTISVGDTSLRLILSDRSLNSNSVLKVSDPVGALTRIRTGPSPGDRSPVKRAAV